MYSTSRAFLALTVGFLTGGAASCSTRDVGPAQTVRQIDEGGSGGSGGGQGGAGGYAGEGGGGAGGCAGEGGGSAGAGGSGGQGGTGGSGGEGCTLTQGYWKNHERAWPVDRLTLGQTSYARVELLAILRTPVADNGLISLAHQLIAARLNVAAGAPAAGIQGALDRADVLIGALVIPPGGKGSLPPAQTSAVNDELTAFNEGKVGPGHCEHGPARPPMGGQGNPTLEYRAPVCPPPPFPPGSID
jgi:hypothetical protein